MSSTENELMLSKTLSEGILRFMHEGLLILDASDRIATVNNIALQVFGFSTDNQLVGTHIRERFFSPADADVFIAAAETKGLVEHWENKFIKSDGKKFTGLYSAFVVKDENGDEGQKVIFIQDFSQRRKTETQLEEYANKLEKNNKDLSQFAYIVSHDLKAPLRAISNLSSWLMEDIGPSLSGDNKKNLEMMRSRVGRMESLINGILEYSKIGSAQVPSESFDVSTLLTEVLALLAPPAHIKVVISEELPIVMAPKILMLQVFSNLISNAIKYNDKKEGLITISATEAEDHFEFSIEDNGPGIDPEHHEKIFLIFQTLQSRDKFESTGIGLTIVKRIVEEQGGKIWLRSEVGKGSTFIFSWPVNTHELT